MKITNKITNKVMKAATDAAATDTADDSAATDDSASAGEGGFVGVAMPTKVAVSNVNSACTFMLHQPKVPALPKRFQK